MNKWKLFKIKTFQKFRQHKAVLSFTGIILLFRCDEGFERSPDNPNICTMAEGIIDCRCNPVGAQEPVCDGEGQCNCKVGGLLLPSYALDG